MGVQCLPACQAQDSRESCMALRSMSAQHPLPGTVRQSMDCRSATRCHTPHHGACMTPFVGGLPVSMRAVLQL